MKIVSEKVSLKDTKLLEAVDAFNLELHANNWSFNIDLPLQKELIQGYTFHCYAMYDNDQLVSFLVYQKYINTIEIRGAWTHPNYRRQKIYNSLFRRLVEDYRKKNFSRIYGGFHKNNAISRKMQESQGRHITPSQNNENYYLSEYEIALESMTGNFR